jgi:hypothetical protein
VSLLRRSELALRIGPRHCRTQWRGIAHAAAGEAALAGAIDGLAAPAPQRAALSVEDEYVYFASLPAATRWKDALGAAQDYFAAMLGTSESLVGISLSPCGRRWIAAAVELAQVQAWEEALAARGIALAAVRPALLDDLQRLRRSVSIADGVIALVRDEGLSLVTLQDGGVVDVAWERCDVTDAGAIAARILAQAGDGATPVCLVPMHGAQAEVLGALAAERGWQLAPALLGELH